MIERNHLLPVLLGTCLLICAGSHRISAQTSHLPYEEGGCTIGVAAGKATDDGRPLVWKSRDSQGLSNEVCYNTAWTYRFVALIDAGRTSYSWVGVNEKGFAILNSAIGDVPGGSGPGNGYVMTIALGTCASVAEFEHFLDSTNVTGRSTQACFGVIDSTGAAKIIETAGNAYWVFDAHNTEHAPDGYIVRTNFSVTGGGNTGIDRFRRSETLMGEFYAGDSLSHSSILRYQMRDFTDPYGNPYNVPYAGQTFPEAPYGYISPDWSICRTSTVAAGVVQGVLPGEPAVFSTMWTLLGQPAMAVAVPYWPVGETPPEANGSQTAPLCDVALQIKGIVFESYYVNQYGRDVPFIDTYKLRDGHGGGIWDRTFVAEDSILRVTEDILAGWRAATPTAAAMLGFESSMAEYALASLQDALGLFSVPDRPVLASPAPGDTGISPSPLLSWHAQSGAASYRVQVSTEADFNLLLVDSGGLGGSSYSAEYLSGARIHYWRVFASNSVGTSPPSYPWAFTTWSGPYLGSRIELPGILEVEWYDGGGEGSTYHDVDEENVGAACRGAEGVDIEQCTDPEGGGFNIGWTKPGEWLRYSVTIASTGPYLLEARVATASSGGGSFHLELDDIDVSGPVTVPATGGDQSWTTVRDTVYLTAGAHALDLEMDQAPPGGEIGNVNFLRFTALPHVTVTIGTSPDSLSYTVDGAVYGGTGEFPWLDGSEHSIGTASVQPGDTGTRYIWMNWSDGGDITHQIEASASAVYTANFMTEYYLTVSADKGGAVTSAGGWLTSDTTVTLTAVPDSGYRFVGWEGTGAGSYSGLDNPTLIRLEGPVTQHARFEAILPLPGPVVLLSPADGALIPADTVQVLWHACGPAVTNYWCEIASDSLFLFKNVDSTSTDTCYTFRELMASTYWWRVRGCNAAGWGPFSEPRKFHVSITSVAHTLEVPTEFSLKQNYPNPFNPVTTIAFDLPVRGEVSLRIYNSIGEEVATLLNEELPAGNYTRVWEAGEVASGVYFYRLTAGEYIQTKKMLLMK